MHRIFVYTKYLHIKDIDVHRISMYIGYIYIYRYLGISV